MKRVSTSAKRTSSRTIDTLKKKNIAYIETNGSNQELHIDFEYVGENEVNLA